MTACPFCGHRTVSTLDHCLTKARHPSLSVTPINLVPSCKDCNHKKGNPSLVGNADQFLNAYYDDVTGVVWLRAEIVEGSPAGIRFFVDAPTEWDAITSVRVINHFQLLEIAKLYASQGGRQLRNSRGALHEFHEAGGIQVVRDDLWRSHRSSSQVDLNSWLTALYRAAAESDWYCDGGFEA